MSHSVVGFFVFFLHGQSWSEIPLTAFTKLQAVIWTSWAFLFNHDHSYWFSSYCRPQKVLSFLSWWEDQVSIAAEFAKEWSIYLRRMNTYWGLGFSPQKTKEPSIFPSLFIGPQYFYDPHNLPKSKSESHLFPIQIILFPGTNFFHFASHVSCFFHKYCSYPSVYALYINFIVPCLHGCITEISFYLLQLQITFKCALYVPVPKCSDFVAGYVIGDIPKWSISQTVIVMFRFQASKYKIDSLQSFSVSWV